MTLEQIEEARERLEQLAEEMPDRMRAWEEATIVSRETMELEFTI